MQLFVVYEFRNKINLTNLSKVVRKHLKGMEIIWYLEIPILIHTAPQFKTPLS